MIQNFLRRSTEKVSQVLYSATSEMIDGGRSHFTPEFVLSGLLDQDDVTLTDVIEAAATADDPIPRLKAAVAEAIRKLPVPEQPLAEGTSITFSDEVKVVLDQALQEARTLGDRFAGTSALFLALLDPRAGEVARILRIVGLDRERVREVMNTRRTPEDRIEDREDESQDDVLKQYTTDLTEMARRGELDPVLGREREIERLIEILSRRKKNNPVLIGEAGVGKSVIVEGLAQAIVHAEVPESMVRKRILTLEMADLVAGASARGQFEQRLKAVRDAVVRASGRIILFIDELHTVVAAGAGGIDASNMLKPALARGRMQVIGATTLDEYRKHIESDRALARRFQPILVGEPTIEETIEILEGLRPFYERHHGVRYADEAIAAAARLSDRYITDRALPDKAVDLLDEAGSRKHLGLRLMPTTLRELENQRRALLGRKQDAFDRQDFEETARHHSELLKVEEQLKEARTQWQGTVADQDATVHADDIAEVVSRWTGVPASRALEAEADRLARMEEEIHHRIVGQEDAVTAVANAIRRNRAGLKAPDRPIGSFLFLGPTGVGKTELAKALAGFLFADETKIIRLDMSEYMERHEVAKMIGAPPGYVGYGEGGQLTERVRRNPYSVVLLDEIEKAHPDIFNLLLQVFDEGILTDAMGRRVSFRNTIIIGTSNLGSSKLAEAERGIGFGHGQGRITYDEARSLVLTEVRKHFRPEFLNRIDDLIVFHPLSEVHIRRIVDLQLAELVRRLAELDIAIDVTAEARDHLAHEGFHPTYGARPLKREIERTVENPLSMRIVSGEVKAGDRVRVELAGNEIVLNKLPRAPAPTEETAAAAAGDGRGNGGRASGARAAPP